MLHPSICLNELITHAFPHYPLFQYQAAALYSNLLHHGAASWPADAMGGWTALSIQTSLCRLNVMKLTSIRRLRECLNLSLTFNKNFCFSSGVQECQAIRTQAFQSITRMRAADAEKKTFSLILPNQGNQFSGHHLHFHTQCLS